MQDTVVQAIENVSKELRELSLKIHDKPELSSKEYFAHDLLADYMESKGFSVQRKACGLETAFIAEYEHGGSDLVVGFFSEFDALPNLGHACGHNLIAIEGVASALGLKAALERFPNQKVRVILFGSPAEETTGGKINMIKDGALENVDVAFMAHPGNQNAIFGKWLAMGALHIEFFGKAAHASAAPWDGVNALDAAILGYQAVSNLRQQTLPTNRIHGVIHKGGERPNIIPDYSKLEYYIRSETTSDLKILIEKVKSCFNGAAISTGCQIKITEEPIFGNVRDNLPLLKSYEKYMKGFGAVFSDESTTLKESRGSTDMGNVTHVVPSIHPLFDIGAKGYSYHTTEFARQAATIEAHNHTLNVAKSLVLVAVDCITKPGFLAQVKQSFENKEGY